MKGLNDFISEDTNQFGPGTDLIVAILALMLILATISSYLYKREIQRNDEGNFKAASVPFDAGVFRTPQVEEPDNKEEMKKRISIIKQEYQSRKDEYSWIFIIGHANSRDIKQVTTEAARMKRNWDFAGRRAAVVARELQAQLEPHQREKIVIVSTGEFDKKNSANPLAAENAYVEVVFGKQWKPPSGTKDK